MQFKTIVKGIFLFLNVLLFGVMTTAHAAVADFEIIETVPQPNVIQFSVTSSYDDVIGFVVGNDYGFDYTAVDEASGWESYVAYNNLFTGDVWKIGVLNVSAGGSGTGLGGLPTITYFTFEEMGLAFDLNDVTDGSFDGYIRAFVYFIVDAEPETINTTGFYAMAGQPDSNFAAFRENGQTIMGETSVVPVPGAGILLFSGLVGLAGLRRKNR